MNAASDSIQVFNQGFKHFEIFTEMLRGFDFDLLQLDRGIFNAQQPQ